MTARSPGPLPTCMTTAGCGCAGAGRLCRWPAQRHHVHGDRHLLTERTVDEEYRGTSVLGIMRGHGIHQRYAAEFCYRSGPHVKETWRSRATCPSSATTTSPSQHGWPRP